MESARLWIRPMDKGDEISFVNGIADGELRTAYGFPVDMDPDVSSQVFRQFCGLEQSLSLVDKESGKMIGFLLAVSPELPDEIRDRLPGKGQTLAYAVFPAFRRQGYMTEALQAVLPALFASSGAAYIHCGHFEDNEPSRKLLRKLGFREFSGHTAGDRLIIDEILFR